ASSTVGKSVSGGAVPTVSPVSPRIHPSVTVAMWTIVERTEDQPGAGSATYWSGVSFRQASRTWRSAQRLEAYSETKSSFIDSSPPCGTRPFGVPGARRGSVAPAQQKGKSNELDATEKAVYRIGQARRRTSW